MKKRACFQFATVCLFAGAAWAGPIEDEQLYDPPQAEQRISTELIGLLDRASQRPDAETRLETLEAIREHKIAALSDAVLRLLQDQRDVVRISAIRAAEALELKQAAEAVAAFVREAPSKNPTQRDLIQVGDAALADWGHAAMTDHWIDRLNNDQASVVLRTSAARSLGQVFADDMSSDVVEALTSAATDSGNPAAVRFAAADAVSTNAAVQPGAVALMAGSLIDRWTGIRMVGTPPAVDTVAALQANARNAEPAVQAAALRVLIDAGPEAAPFDLLADLIDSRDPAVRRLAVEGARLHPTPAAVTFGFAQLNDAHPDVRDTATASLVELARTPALDPAIRTRVTTTIDNLNKFDEAGRARRWGEAQQLARLAHQLDHKPAAMGLTRFYDFPRTEVAIAAVKAVRDLDVPDSRPPTVTLMRDLIAQAQNRKPAAEPDQTPEQLAAASAQLRLVSELGEQTALTLGVWAEPTADSVLKPIVPKNHPIGADVRAAGIWALGHIHAGNPDNALARQLVGRMNDSEGMYPEADNVREQSAVAIGRMHARSQLGAVRKRYELENESLQIRYACRWAVGQITGELPAEITVAPYDVRDVFIAPLR